MPQNWEKRFYKRPRFWKNLGLILGSVIVLLTILAKLFVDPVLKGIITRSVNDASNGLYNLNIKELDFEIWTGDVRMDGVTLGQNEDVLEQMRKISPHENLPAISLYADSARIFDFKWINYLIEDDLEVGLVKISDPVLSISGANFQESLKSTNKNFLELLPGIIAGFAGSLKIRELIVKSGKVKYESEGSEGRLFQKADSIYVDIKKINIDTVADNNTLYSEDIKLTFKDYFLQNEKELQQVSISRAVASLSDSVFWISDFRLVEDDTTNPDSTNIHIDVIKGEGVNFRTFIRGKKVIMNQVTVASPEVTYISDTRSKNMKEQESREPLVPQTILVPEILSGVLQSFNVKLIKIIEGKAYSKTISNTGTTTQEASDIEISIAQVMGSTKDTFNLKAPGQVSISLNNYKFYGSDPDLKLQIKSFDASTETGRLLANNLYMTLSERLKSGGEVVLLTNLDFVSGSGFELKTVLDQQKVVFNKILIKKPDLDIQITGLPSKKDRDKYQGFLPQGLPPRVAEFVKSFEVNQVEADKGNLRYFSLGEGDPVYHSAENVNFTIENLYTKTPKTPIQFDNLSLNVKDYQLKVGREKFSFIVEQANASSVTSDAILKNVKLIQEHPPNIERNHYFIDIPEVSLKGFDVKQLVEKNQFVSDKVVVKNMDANFLIHVGQNIRPPYAEQMPNEIVRNIGFYFNIDTVEFNNAIIRHKNATVDNPTITYFSDSEARVYNLTNDSELMSPGTPAVLRMKTKIMGKGTLYATISIPLLTENLYGHYEGIFTGMDGKPFNPALSNAGVRIESGIIDSAYFNIDIKAGVGEGIVKLLYHDLDVAVLNKEGTKSSLKSFLGRLVIKNRNPDNPGDEPEVQEVRVERGEHDSFFYFIWRPVLEGLIKTVTRDTFLPDEKVEQ